MLAFSVFHESMLLIIDALLKIVRHLFFLLLVLLVLYGLGYVFFVLYLQMKKRNFLIILGLFLITICTPNYFYIQQEHEWKDTIHQSLEEKHYLLPEKVNGKFEPIIKIQDRLKKEGPSFTVTFNIENRMKRAIFPKFYLTGKLRGKEVKNIQVVNEVYLNKQKQFKKLADNAIDLYQVDFSNSGEISGITTDNQEVRVNQDGTELFVNDKKIEGDIHK
ncbi:hypothetical protein D350_00263 [Enterococcus faecalis VC1B-1]|uniref:hypothetical protein n=1 Tax=Enterococcus faecalis TaxID=1351 RepID=UPI00035F38F2|nr:hypothetical protein [Enterococcus faecalis]EPI33358.1 hypothetical protein D350_00263 [Enterococcus faecalis VC1B-1]NSU49504.1 hypothetical protein [Enterococcus faecalis]